MARAIYSARRRYRPWPRTGNQAGGSNSRRAGGGGLCGQSCAGADRSTRRRAHQAYRSDAEGRGFDRCHRDRPPGSSSFHRQADRAGAELRGSGCDRHREHPPAERAAPAHRDLTEALEQQTATSEVLGVISSSPGELEHVFETILANATRLCEAKFANLFLYEKESFRIVAQQNAPRAYAERWRRNPVLVVDDNPRNPLARLAATRGVVDIVDLMAEQGYVERDPRFVALVETAGARTHLLVPVRHHARRGGRHRSAPAHGHLSRLLTRVARLPPTRWAACTARLRYPLAPRAAALRHAIRPALHFVRSARNSSGKLYFGVI